MQKLSQCVQISNYGANYTETVNAIKQAGYDTVFIQWYNEFFPSEYVNAFDYVKSQGLNIEFAHMEYKSINELWQEGITGDELVKRYILDLKELKRRGINKTVMHLHTRPTYYPPNELGFKRFEKILKTASDIGVKIALENTRYIEFVYFVYDRLKNENLGLCLDSGHFHYLQKDQIDFERFKDKIFAVHLHDNHGETDEHLLPYDGNLDFDIVLKGLKTANYNGNFTLESKYLEKYRNMNIVDFYKLSYERVKDLLERYNKM